MKNILSIAILILCIECFGDTLLTTDYGPLILGKSMAVVNGVTAPDGNTKQGFGVIAGRDCMPGSLTEGKYIVVDMSKSNTNKVWYVNGPAGRQEGYNGKHHDIDFFIMNCKDETKDTVVLPGIEKRIDAICQPREQPVGLQNEVIVSNHSIQIFPLIIPNGLTRKDRGTYYLISGYDSEKNKSTIYLISSSDKSTILLDESSAALLPSHVTGVDVIDTKTVLQGDDNDYSVCPTLLVFGNNFNEDQPDMRNVTTEIKTFGINVYTIEGKTAAKLLFEPGSEYTPKSEYKLANADKTFVPITNRTEVPNLSIRNLASYGFAGPATVKYSNGQSEGYFDAGKEENISHYPTLCYNVTLCDARIMNTPKDDAKINLFITYKLMAFPLWCTQIHFDHHAYTCFALDTPGITNLLDLSFNLYKGSNVQVLRAIFKYVLFPIIAKHIHSGGSVYYKPNIPVNKKATWHVDSNPCARVSISSDGYATILAKGTGNGDFYTSQEIKGNMPQLIKNLRTKDCTHGY